MPLIDDRGRLFGRFNMIDASVLLVVCVMLPVAYGAYLLFRPPAPHILGIEPFRVEVGTRRIEVRGEYLRPALRIVVGTLGARFLLADAENGVLELPDVPPGTYDVTLLDEDREVGRLPGALTVFAVPKREVVQPPVWTAELVAAGTFNALDAAQAGKVWNTLRTLGSDQTRPWTVVAVAPPEANMAYLPPEMLPLTDGRFQVSAVLRFRCTFNHQQCVVFDVILGPNAFVPLSLHPSWTTVHFRISEIHPVYTNVVRLMLRSSLSPQELATVQVEWNADRSRSITSAFEPSLESLEVIGETEIKEHIVMGRIRVPAIRTAAGWMHRSRVLRTGDGFAAVRGSHQLTGRIVEVGPAGPLPAR